MLTDLVAEFYGVNNDVNLETVVANSGVSIIDWFDDDGNVSIDARNKIQEAMAQQTNQMMLDEMAKDDNKNKLVDMLFQLSQIEGINVHPVNAHTGMRVSRKDRRTQAAKERKK